MDLVALGYLITKWMGLFGFVVSTARGVFFLIFQRGPQPSAIMDHFFSIVHVT